MIAASLQWAVADALGARYGVRWPRVASGWRCSSGALSADDARCLVADLRGAEIHAVAVPDDGMWWVEADVDGRDCYTAPRPERDYLQSQVLRALRYQ